MSMDMYDTILLILYHRRGADLGRVAIQRLAYVSSCTIPSLHSPSYVMQYDGIYSEGLSHALERLISHSFVMESKVQASSETYCYKLSDDGIAMARRLNGTPESRSIQSMMAHCMDICRCDPDILASVTLSLHGINHDSGNGGSLALQILKALGVKP